MRPPPIPSGAPSPSLRRSSTLSAGKMAAALSTSAARSSAEGVPPMRVRPEGPRRIVSVKGDIATGAAISVRTVPDAAQQPAYRILDRGPRLGCQPEIGHHRHVAPVHLHPRPGLAKPGFRPDRAHETTPDLVFHAGRDPHRGSHAQERERGQSQSPAGRPANWRRLREAAQGAVSRQAAKGSSASRDGAR